MISADQVRAVLADIRKLPYIALYVGDWVRDPVSGCSLAAQMLWMRMMFLMHDAPIYGHLADAKGQPLVESAVVRMCGLAARDYPRLLEELKSAGVPRETGDQGYAELLTASINDEPVDLSPLRVTQAGVIYSRRMVRDHRLRVIRRLAGSLGDPKRGNLGYQNQNLGYQSADARAGVRAENENALDSPSPKLVHQEGVQGEGRTPAPDWPAVARVVAKIDESALRDSPNPQLVEAWLKSGIDEALIIETLADCESSYRGKGYKYFEKILYTRRDDPSLRPGKRRTNGNGNGNGRSESAKVAEHRRDFGHKDARDRLKALGYDDSKK